MKHDHLWNDLPEDERAKLMPHMIEMQILTNRVLALEEQISALVSEVSSIMNESEGVAGYHLNNDVASWSEFTALNSLLEKSHVPA